MRPFTDILRDIRRGRVVDAATEELAEVVRAVVATQKPGEFTLTLKVKPQGKDDHYVVVSATMKAKRPQADLPDAMFYADLEGDLLREDPGQQDIFTDASGAKIDRATGEVLAS